MLRVTYPCRIVSEANRREHWAKKAKRAKAQRKQAHYSLLDVLQSPDSLPDDTDDAFHSGSAHYERHGAVIRLTRISPRKLDSDNLARAFKAVRDGVADWLGIDDGDERLTWLYDQRQGEPRQHAVCIEVWAKDEWDDEEEAWTA